MATCRRSALFGRGGARQVLFTLSYYFLHRNVKVRPKNQGRGSVMHRVRMLPGQLVRIKNSQAVDSPTIGVVIRGYGAVIVWYEVQVDESPEPHVYREDELARVPAL